jgi:aryl-phospho-beta-D-glucosidase BglC (GH1 family)
VVPPALLEGLKRCVNISRWFRYPAEDSEAHYRGFITDADLDLIVSMGVTGVRLAVDPRFLHLSRLDEAVARMTRRGLVVVLDYHDESREIESGPAAEAELERTWAALAAHFGERTSPSQVLLEIFNEPVFDTNPAAWFPIRRRLVEVIRSAAPHHTIVAGGPNWSSLDGLLNSRPLGDDNVVYTFHFYEPFEFTHQGAPWVQGPLRDMSQVRYPEISRSRRDVATRIRSAAAWGARYGVPVWAGEFGAYPAVAPAADRLRWLRDVRAALEQSRIGWAVWSYDESLGLDRRPGSAGRIAIDWDSAAALGLRTPPATA